MNQLSDDTSEYTCSNQYITDVVIHSMSESSRWLFVSGLRAASSNLSVRHLAFQQITSAASTTRLDHRDPRRALPALQTLDVPVASGSDVCSLHT